jgi:hypothetical protein
MSTRALLLLVVLNLFAGVGGVRALEFRVASWEGDITDLNYSRDGEIVPVLAAENVLSPAYRWSGPEALILFKETKEKDKTVRITVAKLTPPAKLTNAILILSAVDSARTTYTGLWLDDSLEARPLQTITYRNLSRYVIGVRLGDSDYTIPPQSSCTHLTGAAVQRVVLKAAAQTASGWEIIASTSQTNRPGRRTLVLLRDGRPQPNGHVDLVDFIIFNDRPRPPEPPGTPVAGR